MLNVANGVTLFTFLYCEPKAITESWPSGRVAYLGLCNMDDFYYLLSEMSKECLFLIVNLSIV